MPTYNPFELPLVSTLPIMITRPKVVCVNMVLWGKSVDCKKLLLYKNFLEKLLPSKTACPKKSGGNTI
jgi:hypothetical protein